MEKFHGCNPARPGRIPAFHSRPRLMPEAELKTRATAGPGRAGKTKEKSMNMMLKSEWIASERQYRSQVAEARINTADEAWEIAREDAGLVYILVPLIYPLAFAAMPEVTHETNR